jgi:hypothetical protein
VPGTGQALRLELDQPFGGEADHLVQQIGVGALSQKLAKDDAVVGHHLGVVVAARNPTLSEIPRWPSAVDNWPVCARLVAVASTGQLPTAPTPPAGT